MSKKKVINRRQLLSIAGLAGTGAVIAACAPQVLAPAAEPPQAVPAVPEPTATTYSQVGAVTDSDALAFWTPGGSAPYCANFNLVSKNFMAKNPTIKVAETQCGVGEQNFIEVFMARVAAGNPPDTSIIWDSPASLAVRGALEPLDELMNLSEFSQASNWPSGVLASCIFQGKTYGLPVAASTYAMYYNTVMFEQKGISTKREDFPKTWAEMRRLSKEFTAWDGEILKTTGFLPFPPVLDMVEMNVWSALNGSQFYDGTANKFTIDSENNIEMFQYFLDWLNEDYKGNLTAITSSANWGFYADSNGRPPEFQMGTMAMQSSGFWVAGDMYTSKFSPAGEKWDAAQYPVGPSGSGTKSGYWPNWMVIPKGAKKREDAFKYMDYMGKEGVISWFAVAPDMPTNKNVDTSVLKVPIVLEKRGAEFHDGLLKFFFGQMDVATPMWTSPVQGFANDQITRMMEQIFNKTATPKDALVEAQKACQTELETVLKA